MKTKPRKILRAYRLDADVFRELVRRSDLLARTQNAAQVAEWLGNSVDILRGHYKELVTNADTERFWALAH